MRFLVFGATGAQGGAVARRLVAEGHAVRGFGRTTGVPEGVEAFPGDLGDAARVKAAFAGVTHASVILPMVYEPDLVSAYVRNVIEGAGAAGVRRLVFNTANRLPDTDTGVAAFDTRRAAVRTMLTSGLPVVVLRPSLYLDNLLMPGVLESGVLRYPLPGGLPVAWLSHADLAALTLAALTREGLSGVLNAGGPEAVTGATLAAAAGARYEELDVDAFAAGLGGALGEATAREVAATYRWIAATRPAGLFAASSWHGLELTPPREWMVGAEIVRHHRVIEGWLAGTGGFEAFEGAHAPGFTMVTPGGEVLSRERMLAEVAAARGADPGLRVEIRDARVIAEAGPLVVAAYEEWQRGRGRRATAVLRREDGALRWTHLHETWIS
ncbi:NmrA family NAD(P)-binding protein [Nonomuraea sp. SBT364]|uniref:NmrA family NAD(P)-binding protein n=1 Tax=Nonomuraea sp. SBT364 TaxID=1580530 RepID=UPI00069F75BF|nr:NAD(P)H-binding protein [Nonomuraea sp. SBT364]